ncbi:fructosamine kinase family protein [soil metagenome]
MTRAPAVTRRAERLLGTSVVATAPVAGGDIATATKLRLADGSTALMKTMANAPAGFFPAEAASLRWLSGIESGAAVPPVLAAEEDCVILRWIEHGRPATEGADAFGRALAATHAHGPAIFGLETDGFIGRLPMRNTTKATWAEFYAVNRVLPYLKVASDRGAITPAGVAAVEALVGRLPSLLPVEPPARLHGDLWNGNVVWDTDGRAWLVDPAAYAGHREMDLAMMSLFGLPNLARVIAAYHEATPLAEGWEERVGIHQIFPLLVHACLFGGGYGARAASVAAAFTRV